MNCVVTSVVEGSVVVVAFMTSVALVKGINKRSLCGGKMVALTIIVLPPTAILY